MNILKPHVSLNVSNIDRSIAFYRDQVGFDLDHDTRNEHMHVTQQNGMLEAAAHAQTGIRLQLGVWPLHARARGRDNLHVQLQIPQENGIRGRA